MSRATALHLLTALIAAFTISGCIQLIQKVIPQDPPELEVKMLSQEKFTPVTTGEQIQVITSRSDLPVGFLFHQYPNNDKKLLALPGYPSANLPHVIIGAITHQETGGMGTSERMLQAYQAKAAEMGGNALFSSSKNEHWAYVIRISNAYPSTENPSVDKLLAQAGADFGDYQPDGEVKTIDLKAALPVEFKTRSSRCYAVALALEPDASLGEKGRRGLYGSSRSMDQLMFNHGFAAKEQFTSPEGLELSAPQDGPFVNMRSMSAFIGCSEKDSAVALELRGPGRAGDLGQGRIQVQLLSKKISSAELKTRLKDHQEAVARARAEAEAARQEELRLARERAARQEEERKRAEEERRQAASAPSTGGGSQTFSLTLKNNCSRTVKIFIGDKPKWGSGTYSSVSSNSVNSYSGFAPQSFWIIDDSQNGISSYTTSPGSQRIQITPSCSGFARD